MAIATATDVLQINALTRIVFGVLLLAGQVLSGVVVFAIGLYLANLAFNLITSTGGTSDLNKKGFAKRSLFLFGLMTQILPMSPDDHHCHCIKAAILIK